MRKQNNQQHEENPFLGLYETNNGDQNVQPSLQTDTNNALKPTDVDSQFNNVASAALEPEIKDISLKETGKNLIKLESQNENTKLMKTYKELYFIVHGENPSEDIINKSSNPAQGNAQLTKKITHLENQIKRKETEETQKNKAIINNSKLLNAGTTKQYNQIKEANNKKKK
jgi:hypothetical protein